MNLKYHGYAALDEDLGMFRKNSPHGIIIKGIITDDFLLSAPTPKFID